jgi:hypothetical protein
VGLGFSVCSEVHLEGVMLREGKDRLFPTLLIDRDWWEGINRKEGR